MSEHQKNRSDYEDHPAQREHEDTARTLFPLFLMPLCELRMRSLSRALLEFIRIVN